MKPSMIIHGGAGQWSPDQYDEAVAGVQEATQIGWEILQAGKPALDAVEKAVNFLEDHPLYDAGKGSHLNTLGEVEMDALFIDASTHNYGAVAGVKHVQYPISLARRVMTDTNHCFIIGAGADRLALELGFSMIPNIDFVTEAELSYFHNLNQVEPSATGTVGAVALDANGNLASATSTGGTRNKLPGRVGDSPIFGAGGYADNQYGAASATGVGENIMRVMLSRYVIDQIAEGKTAQEAATAGAAYIDHHYEHSRAGIIIVDKQGRVGAAHTTAAMPIGWVDEKGAIQASMGGGKDRLR